MTARRRNIKIKPRYKAHPDVWRLTRAVLAPAEADAERAAQAEREREQEQGRQQERSS